MMKYSYLKQNTLGHYCRNCINKEYRLTLTPKDCIYMEYQYECKKCNELKNIVYDVRKRSRYKLFFA